MGSVLLDQLHRRSPPDVVAIGAIELEPVFVVLLSISRQRAEVTEAHVLVQGSHTARGQLEKCVSARSGRKKIIPARWSSNWNDI